MATPTPKVLRPFAVEPLRLDDYALFALRFFVGFELFAHGMQKFGEFGGVVAMDGSKITGSAAVRAQAQFLDLLGYHPSLALSWFLTFTELIGGLLLIFGLLTPLAAGAALGDAFNLIFGLGWQMDWFGNSKGPGYELAVLMIVAAFAVCLLGPGRWSVDRALGLRIWGWPWGVAGVVVGLIVLVGLGPGFGGADLPPLPTP